MFSLTLGQWFCTKLSFPSLISFLFTTVNIFLDLVSVVLRKKFGVRRIPGSNVAASHNVTTKKY